MWADIPGQCSQAAAAATTASSTMECLGVLVVRCEPDARQWLTVDVQAEDLRSHVMAGDVEVEPRAHQVRPIQCGGQDAFTIEFWSVECFAQRIDDAATTGNQDIPEAISGIIAASGNDLILQLY